jgi:hypothetical protein
MIPSLFYLDRYRNEGTRTYSQHAGYTEARERYRPNSKHSDFDLAVFEVPSDLVNVYTHADPPTELEDTYLPPGKALFCIHPQVMEEHKDDPYIQRARSVGAQREPIRVSPSSSTRTVYVQGPVEPHALKVHFPFRVSRYGRRMREEVVEQAVNVSRQLEGAIPSLGAGFAYLREVIGVAHRNLHPQSPRGENWGYLVRAMTPFPAVAEERTLIPGFALYGKDFFDPVRPALIHELVGDADPLRFVMENIMLPVIRHWVGCFLELGLILEPHGQNILFEADGDGRIHRIVHRDMSLGIDMRRRRDLGMPDESLNSYNRMESGQFNSIAFDKFMGGHFFDAIVACLLEAHPGLRREDFVGPCREELTRVFPEHANYLPRTIHYFSEERDQFGKPLYQDTGRAPDWRP